MSSSKPIRNIAIIADQLSAGVVTSMMTARLPASSECKFDVLLTENSSLSSTIYARPNIRHLHQLLQIKEHDLTTLVGGEMVMALPMISHSGQSFMLPFGEYGVARQGCGFQHYWRRAYETGQVSDLEYYNFAIRLAQSAVAVEQAPVGCPMVDPGYRFDRVKYGQYLFKLALKSGQVRYKALAGPEANGNDQHDVGEMLAQTKRLYDLVVHVSEGLVSESSGWRKNYIHICPNAELPGFFLYQVQSAITRLFEFWPQQSRMTLEAHEYNRRVGAEEQHISDMQYLCKFGASGGMSDSLKRKVDLFRAKGRVAFEDYDVFSSQEWIAALRASAVDAVGYDRLADRLSVDDIIEWFKRLDTAMSMQIKHLSVESS